MGKMQCENTRNINSQKRTKDQWNSANACQVMHFGMPQLTIPSNHDQPQPNEHDYCGFKLLRLISVLEEPYFEQFSKTYVGQEGDYADSIYNRY